MVMYTPAEGCGVFPPELFSKIVLRTQKICTYILWGVNIVQKGGYTQLKSWSIRKRGE